MTLGLAPQDAMGGPWMMPCAPAESSRKLVERFSRAPGREIRLRGMPRVLQKVVGLVVPMLREIGEMLHQWEVPFVVDDSRFRETFDARPTDPGVGAADTVAWAVATFGKDGETP